MEAIDTKILKELQSLPEGFKQRVLVFIEGLKKKEANSSSAEKAPKAEKQDASPPGYGNAREYLSYIPYNLDEISVSGDFEDYM